MDPRHPDRAEDGHWNAFIAVVFESFAIAVGSHLLWWFLQIAVTVNDEPLLGLRDDVLWLALSVVGIGPAAWWWVRRTLRAQVASGGFSPALQVPMASVGVVVAALLAAGIPVLLDGTALAGDGDSGSWFFMAVAVGVLTMVALRLAGSRKDAPGWPPQRDRAAPGAGAAKRRRKTR